MKTHLMLSIFFIFILLACEKQLPETSDKATESHLESTNRSTSFSVGYNFNPILVSKKVHVDGQYKNAYQFVNPIFAVDSLNSPTTAAQHWSYQSPSLSGQEIGFSIVADLPCLTGNCEVVLFLHGNEGSENAGASFYKNYLAQYRDSNSPKVFIFANGITREKLNGDKGNTWKPEPFTDAVYLDPQRVLKELIGGIVEDNSGQFDFMSKDMNDWSVLGFSAGSNATIGLFLNPLFYQSPEYQPRLNFACAGWMGNINDYFPYDPTALSGCSSSPVKFLLALHDQDNSSDCIGNTVYSFRQLLVGRLLDQDMPFTFLGLSRDIQAICLPPNPAHKPGYYLNHTIANPDHIIDNVINCHNPNYLDVYTTLGDAFYN